MVKSSSYSIFKSTTRPYYLARLNASLLTISLLFSGYAQSQSVITWKSTHSLSNSTKQNVRNWINNGVKASQVLFKVLPQRTLYFEIEAQPNAKEPVPWGQVTRDKFNTINLHIDEEASLSSLINDWTLYHEIAHVYLPFLDDESIWLSEGFASYIQNIVMLKANIHNQAAFVEKINAGFVRGKNSTKRNKGALNKVSASMHSTRAYMRVYWSGAAFFLEADRQLQRKGTSLTTVISHYISCCLRPEASGDSLVRSLDRISNTSIFSSLFKIYRTRTDFPNISVSEISASSEYYLSKTS